MSNRSLRRGIAALVAATAAIWLPVQAAHAAAAGGFRPASGVREDSLDPTPVDPAAERTLDLFVNDYRNARPRTEYGALVFHDILTKTDQPDPLRPARAGAVLEFMTAVSYATLAPGATARGRGRAGDREVFYTSAGTGRIVANGKTHEVKEGVGFTLTEDFDFTLTNTGRAPLGFYVRTEALPYNFPRSADVVVVDRFDNDRRVGAHWWHICNGGPNGMLLCTIAPRTMPQPHAHPVEEIWVMVKGETVLTLGKKFARMAPGQAYRIPPNGMVAHSNINLGEEPVQMIYMGQAARNPTPPRAPQRDHARLDERNYVRDQEQDVDMYMGDWRDAPPRIVHGNLYFRDMLTALKGPDALHPTRRGSVLTNAEAVSYVQLEPGSTAHRIEGELKGVQQTFVVNSGAGSITVGTRKVDLQKDMAFIVTPGLDFRLTATGDRYMTFYVVTEKVPEGFTPRTTLQVVDNRAGPQTTANWYNRERALISKADGLSQYGAVTQVELKPQAMSRPYSSFPGTEEIWIATEGHVDLLIGKELRRLPAGTAYRAPEDGITAHANINATDKPAKFLYMVK